MSYLNLEHKLLEVLKKESLGSNFIVSVSAGLDSMALLHSLLSLKKQLKLNLKVGYIHHGLSHSSEQVNYRDHCYSFIEGFCKKNELQFLSNKGLKPKKILTSEGEMRNHRLEVYDWWLKEFPMFKVALGHHKNDLLENKLIQMIRGCGEKGFLSMALKSDYKVRPMIQFSKVEIEDYVKAKNIQFISDPSNNDDKYLRNWLRNKWLPQLEAYRAGGVASLAGSLENLGLNLEDNKAKFEESWAKVYNASRHCLKLTSLHLEPEAMRLSVIAHYLRLNNTSKFSRNQLKEILKHLDSSQKKHSFKMLNQSWLVQDGEVIVQQK